MAEFLTVDVAAIVGVEVATRTVECHIFKLRALGTLPNFLSNLVLQHIESFLVHHLHLNRWSFLRRKANVVRVPISMVDNS